MHISRRSPKKLIYLRMSHRSSWFNLINQSHYTCLQLSLDILLLRRLRYLRKKGMARTDENSCRKRKTLVEEKKKLLTIRLWELQDA